ncbi:MAG: heavy metal-binding domain-containing protein [Pseudonocardiales bacterium]
MTSMQPDAIASARLSESGRVWTSDLSVSEFALLGATGFEPVEFVMGSSVFHIGWQQQNLRQSVELHVLTQAMYTARMNAMNRMIAEAAQVKADGIVGTQLQFRRNGISADHIEFIAVGTAVRARDRSTSYLRPDGMPFTSHLGVQDFYTLLQTGHIPVEFVMGVCVWHVAQQGFMQTLRQMGMNVEMPQWTQGYYDARELALSRMQAEAERVKATGVTGVEWSASEWMWGVHTLEFFTSGTAVRRVGSPDPVSPTLVLPLR